MGSDAMLVSIAEGIATITFNRPKSLNALDLDMALALREAVLRVADDGTVRVVIIRGAGAHFMAGGDVKAFDGMLKTATRQADFERMVGALHDAVIRLRSLDQPVIVSVQGAVAGFGFSLMNACDLAVAADNAYFTLAYCHLGTTPDGGATWSLPRIVGLKQAMELALLGERFDVQRALQLGLVNRVVAAADLEAETLALARRLASGPGAAYARTKRLLIDSADRTLAEQLLAEQQNFVASTQTEDFAEGVHAFVDKQKPRFRGH